MSLASFNSFYNTFRPNSLCYIMSQCEYCNRKFVESNTKVGELEGKPWCGGCSKNVSYISYPPYDEYYGNGILFRWKPEGVPSSPPWTTWSGVIQCLPDSPIGKKLLEMDPNVCEGYEVVRGGGRVPLPTHIRGLWTA
jgi:hypothetical protein